MAENQSIGALWKHKTDEGLVYLSGTIEVGGNEYRIAVFKNKYKKEDRHPDYRILPQTQQAKQTTDDEFIG